MLLGTKLFPVFNNASHMHLFAVAGIRNTNVFSILKVKADCFFQKKLMMGVLSVLKPSKNKPSIEEWRE